MTTTQIVLLLFLLPFASYLIAEHNGVSGIGRGCLRRDDHHPFWRNAPRAWQCVCARTVRAMLEFVFNGMVFLLLGLRIAGYSGIFAGGGGS